MPENKHRDGGVGRPGLVGLGLGSMAAQDGRFMSCSVLMLGLEEQTTTHGPLARVGGGIVSPCRTLSPGDTGRV